jgi:hypothetical protein
VHSFARLRGHGVAIVPKAPYVIRRIGDGSDDRVAIDHDGRRAVIDAHGKLDASNWHAVAEVTAVNSANLWQIEFGRFSVDWPNHFALASSDLAGVPFELWGDGGAGIFPQGPFDPPPVPEQMIAAGQRVLTTGHEERWSFVDLGYVHDGRMWIQRHTVCQNGWVITAQAPEAQAEQTLRAAALLAGRISV